MLHNSARTVGLETRRCTCQKDDLMIYCCIEKVNNHWRATCFESWFVRQNETIFSSSFFVKRAGSRVFSFPNMEPRPPSSRAGSHDCLFLHIANVVMRRAGVYSLIGSRKGRFDTHWLFTCSRTRAISNNQRRLVSFGSPSEFQESNALMDSCQ